MVEFAAALKFDFSLTQPKINLIELLLKRGRAKEAENYLEQVGPLSSSNAARIAEAITTTAKAGSVPAPDLRHFAQRAHELYADDPELKAALATLEAPPA